MTSYSKKIIIIIKKNYVKIRRWFLLSELVSFFFARENKRGSYKKVYENQNFCNSVMPSEYTKILEFNQCQKSDKAPFIIYADLECLIEKIDGCKNNPENSFTIKVSEHIPAAFSMSTISWFKGIENKHDIYRGKDCMKKFCKSLREHAIKIVSFIKKKIKLSTKEQQESHERKICKKKEKCKNIYKEKFAN